MFVHRIRWLIAILIAVAVAVGYVDRQTLALTKNVIQEDVLVSPKDFGDLQFLFFLAYALMYVGGGRLMDFLGARRGFLVIVVCWSLACACHGLAGIHAVANAVSDVLAPLGLVSHSRTGGLFLLQASRLMLGLAQGGIFPGAAKAVAEWFPAAERGTAMGMANGGSSVGAVLAPPAVAMVLLFAPWPWVFYLSGALGLPWAAWWLWEYFPPADHPRLSAEERRELGDVLASAPGAKAGISWWRLLAFREVWGMVLGKACCDAIWFTYCGWMLTYLADMRGFDSGRLGSLAWIPFAASGIGSVAGGWLSGRLLRSGYSLDFLRKFVLGVSAAAMPCMCLVTHVSVGWEIALFSIAFFAHLSFSTLVITLPADMFPKSVVGSVAGLVGFGGSMGGALFNKFAGHLVGSMGGDAGYSRLFSIGSVFHVAGFLLILLTVRKIRPIMAFADSAAEQA